MNRYFHVSSKWIKDDTICVIYTKSSYFAGDFGQQTTTVSPEEFKQMFGYAKRRRGKTISKKGRMKHGLDMA